MPVLLEGSTAGLKVRGAPGFIDALERASAGLEVIPFAAAEREGELSGDLPSLEDHFGR
jgi:hypothetical protein